jgi:hypothetical protein
MHWTTAKLIALERAEGFLAPGWAIPSQVAFAEQAKALRREIPPPLVATYDQLKTEHKEPVVGVRHAKCDGCHSVLSPAALARLSAERAASHCEHCGRFIYLAAGHNLAPHLATHPTNSQETT